MKDKLRGQKRKIANDNLGEKFEQFLQESCANILAVSKGAVYICMSSSELATLPKSFRDTGGHLRRPLREFVADFRSSFESSFHSTSDTFITSR